MSSRTQQKEPVDMVNSRIEKLANQAFGSAYAEALASEDGVCAVVDGFLYRIFADGSREKIKSVAKRISIDPKKTYTLKA